MNDEKGKECVAKGRTIISMINTERMKDDFCAIGETLWYDIIREEDEKQSSPDDLRLLADCCRRGWNIAAESLDEAEAVQRLCRESGEPPDDKARIALELTRTAILLKFRWCPRHRVPVDKVMMSVDEGQPEFDVKFDVEGAMKQDEAAAAALPHFSEHLDRDALRKAVEGLPPDQIENALKAAIQKQVDFYNNTPQAALDGLTPDEMARHGPKRR